MTKLLNIVQPTNAYFGQKDAAQCVLIKRIVDDLNIPVEVQIMETVRESDGLAMSSRNAYLSPEERKIVPIVYASLQAGKALYASRMEASSDATTPAKELIDEVKRVLHSEPLVSEVQYVAVDDRNTMQPLDEVGSTGAVVSLACKVGSVRLIDNIILS